MRAAYADPPYPGCAHLYGCDEIDHAALIKRLCDEYPESWALSTSSPALREVLALCPSDVRVAAWVKPFASFKPGVNPGYAWEPVIFCGGRKRERTEDTVRDYVAASITLERGLVGAKPKGFCFWLFDLLGLRPNADDEFVDLFPGSGAVTAAWDEWRSSLFTGVIVDQTPTFSPLTLV